MPRPRKQRSGLPSYCYRDAKNGAYYMLCMAEGGKLRRRTYGDDLHRMLDDWAKTWGASIRQGDLVSTALDAYIGRLAQRRHRGEIQESTEKDYRKHAGKLQRVFGHVRMVDIDVPMLSRWREVRGAKSPTQFNHERTVLLETFKVAIELGMVTANPVSLLAPLKLRPRDRYAEHSEVNAVLAHAPKPVQAAILLAISTGLRQGDILKLKHADFSEAGLTFRPNKTKGRSKKALHFPWSRAMRMAHELAERKVAGIEGYWLTGRAGDPYTSSGFRAMWTRAMEKALAANPDMPRFTFHDLRAKAGTDSDDWGLLGHLDQKTHSRVYDRKPRIVKPAR